MLCLIPDLAVQVGRNCLGLALRLNAQNPTGLASFWEAEMEATGRREAMGRGWGDLGLVPPLPQKRQGSITEPLWVAFLTSDLL